MCSQAHGGVGLGCLPPCTALPPDPTLPSNVDLNTNYLCRTRLDSGPYKYHGLHCAYLMWARRSPGPLDSHVLTWREKTPTRSCLSGKMYKVIKRKLLGETSVRAFKEDYSVGLMSEFHQLYSKRNG